MLYTYEECRSDAVVAIRLGLRGEITAPNIAKAASDMQNPTGITLISHWSSLRARPITVQPIL